MACGFPYCGGADCANCHKPPACGCDRKASSWGVIRPTSFHYAGCALRVECPNVPGAMCLGAECADGCFRTRGLPAPAPSASALRAAAERLIAAHRGIDNADSHGSAHENAIARHEARTELRAAIAALRAELEKVK